MINHNPLSFCVTVYRLIDRTENIKIFEVDKCRDIFSHQNRLQIFFPKQNICAGHSYGQPIKIVISNVFWFKSKKKTQYSLLIHISAEPTNKPNNWFDYKMIWLIVYFQRSNGASLICLHEHNERNGNKYHYYVLYGLLAWTNDSTNIDHTVSPHLFTNIYNYRYWFEKRLKKPLLR